MEFLTNLLSTIDRRYLVRAYIISALFVFIIYYAMSQSPQGVDAVFVLLLLLFGLLFPFAKLVWDELKALMLGDTLLIMPIIFLYPAKFIINGVIFAFAPFIAPFGLLWMWWRSREAA